jgi:WD40 repeat protein
LLGEPLKRSVRLLLKMFAMRAFLVITILLTLCATQVVKAQSVALKYSLNTGGDLRSATFSPDGSLLAIVSGTRTDISFWDSATGKSIAKFSTGKDPANYVGESNFLLTMPRPGFMGLRFSPDARILAVAAQVTRDLRLWDMKTGKLFTTLSGVKKLTSFEFSPDGRMLALAMGTQGLKLIDVYTGQPLSDRWNFKHVETITGVDFSKDGTTLIVGVASTDDRNSGFYFVDIASGTIKSSILSPASRNLIGQINHDRSRVVTFESINNDLKVWDLNTGQLKNTINAGTSKIIDAAISYDGMRVAAITKDGKVQTWDADTSVLRREIQKLSDKPIYVAFAPDPDITLIVSAKSVKIWSNSRGDVSPALAEARAAFDFSPDGQFLVTDRKGGGAQLWEIRK